MKFPSSAKSYISHVESPIPSEDAQLQGIHQIEDALGNEAFPLSLVAATGSKQWELGQTNTKWALNNRRPLFLGGLGRWFFGITLTKSSGLKNP